jgi:hypothetical protein
MSYEKKSSKEDNFWSKGFNLEEMLAAKPGKK